MDSSPPRTNSKNLTYLDSLSIYLINCRAHSKIRIVTCEINAVKFNVINITRLFFCTIQNNDPIGNTVSL